MNVQAIMNRLEDYKNEREVVVQVGGSPGGIKIRVAIKRIDFDEETDEMVIILAGTLEAEDDVAS